jgi:hypothetical protein
MAKLKIKLPIVLLLILTSLLIISPASARAGQRPLADDEVVFFGTFRLESGETLDGSLVVFGGVVTLEEDSEVTGDVLVFGGNVTVAGSIRNSLVAIGGVVTLESTAVVRGDLIAPATVVRREDGAKIFGQIITENIPQVNVPEIIITAMPETPEIPEVVPPQPTVFDNFLQAIQPVLSFFGVLARALIFSAVAVLIGLMLPRNNEKVQQAVEEHPVLAGGFGLLSVGVFVSAVIMLALLSVTVILIPLTIPLIVLFSLALTLGLLFGLVAVSQEVGRRIMSSLKREWTPSLQMALGAFSLAFVLGLFSIGLWGFLGGVLWTLVGAIGLGAVLLTRFGTQAYIRRQPALAEAAPEAAQEAALVDDEQSSE